MSKAKRTIAAITLAAVAAGFLVASLKLPLWHLRMEAPQYREEEALRVNVFAGSMNGDLGEINVLNQYIGVHVPEVLPQSRWLPSVLGGAAVLGILASLLPGTKRRIALGVVTVALAGAVTFAVFQAKQQMYDIGHKRDAHTKMARVRDFNPPFLGTAKIAQFTVSSWLGTGAYMIGGAILLLGGAAVASRGCPKKNCSRKGSHQITPFKTSEALA
jgi:copper chaperone NosL